MIDELGTKVNAIFEQRLPVCMGGDFERRDSQQAMAQAVARALTAAEIAVIEAGTGLGKSLAYLIPVLIYCRETGARAVISTYTRTLQRQLLEKDFPTALRAIGETIEGAVLMGRTNYACKRAVKGLPGRGGALSKSAAGIMESILADESGEVENIPALDYLDGSIRSKICCPSRDSACTGCGIREECFLLRARKQAAAASILFVNHALLFSHLSGGGTSLGSFDVLVIDEAHHLEEAATSFLTINFSTDSIAGSERSLFSPVLMEMIEYARAMALKNHPDKSEEIETVWGNFLDSADSAHVQAREFLRAVSRSATQAADQLGVSNTRVAGNQSLVFSQGSPFLYGMDECSSKLEEALTASESQIENMLSFLDFDDGCGGGEISNALLSVQEATREVRDTFDFLIAAEDDEFVFYLKCGSPGEAAELSAAPIDVSAQLGSFLEELAPAVILTSATLAVDGDLSYTLHTTGLVHSKRVKPYLFDSPFEMERQRAVLLAAYMPQPGGEDFISETASTLSALAAKTGKKMLVLCTSRRQVRALSDFLSKRSETAHLVLPQTAGSNRSAIAKEFESSQRKILLGLASFWEGVDFPGELLEVVVIIKMPFLVPSEPITRARAEKLRREGENAFEKLFLPAAVLKLKQGAGRLIRTGRDRGVVILLDSRLSEKDYGAVVLKSVTGNFRRCDDLEQLLSEVAKVFNHSNFD